MDNTRTRQVCSSQTDTSLNHFYNIQDFCLPIAFLWDTSKLDQRRAVKKFNFKRFFLCVSGSCTSVCNWFLHETWHTWLKSFTYCFVATLEFCDLQWSSWCLPKSMSDDASASLSSWDPKGYPISSSLIFGPLVEPHGLFSHLHRRVTTSKTLAFVIGGTSPDTISCSQGAGWLCLRPCPRLWCYAHVTFSVVASGKPLLSGHYNLGSEPPPLLLRGTLRRPDSNTFPCAKWFQAIILVGQVESTLTGTPCVMVNMWIWNILFIVLCPITNHGG